MEQITYSKTLTVKSSYDVSYAAVAFPALPLQSVLLRMDVPSDSL